MKKYIVLILIVSSLFFSCERVVDIDLNDVAPALVVEGRVYEDYNEDLPGQSGGS